MRVTQIESMEPPDDLSEEAKAFWRSVVPELTAAAILTTLDIPAFVRLSEAYADMMIAIKRLRIEGTVLKRQKLIRQMNATTKDGRNRNYETVVDLAPVVNPVIYERHEAEARFWRYMDRFGMTPAARIAMAKKLEDRGYPPPAPLDLDALDEEVRREMVRREMAIGDIP